MSFAKIQDATLRRGIVSTWSSDWPASAEASRGLLGEQHTN
jgi:hypothetical protein